MLLSSMFTLLGADSSNISSHASVNCYVGDAFALSLSIQSSNASLSRWTVMGSNADGLRTALVNPLVSSINTGDWSIVTTVLASGVYTVTPGFRWLDVFRAPWDVSASSNVTIRLTMQVQF